MNRFALKSVLDGGVAYLVIFLRCVDCGFGGGEVEPVGEFSGVWGVLAVVGYVVDVEALREEGRVLVELEDWGHSGLGRMCGLKFESYQGCLFLR